METLIEDLKKVMNSEIKDKDKYMKMLINGFLREKDCELLTIQGVVKSLKDKETMTFEDWLISKGYEPYNVNIFVKGDSLMHKIQLKEMYEAEKSL